MSDSNTKATNTTTNYEPQLISRLFFSLMPATIMIGITTSINSIVDGIIASNFIDSLAISAIGFFTPIITIINAIHSTIQGGCSILVGNHLGKGEEKKASSIFSLDMLSCFSFVTLLCSLIFFLAPFVAKLLGATGDAATNTVDYIRGVIFSFPGVCLATHLSSYLQLEQRMVRNYVAVVVMAVINIALDVVFIVVLKKGCLGLGLATTISSWVYFLILAQYYFTGKSQLKFSIKGVAFSVMPEVLKIGLPGAVTQIYITIRAYVYNRMIVQYEGQYGMAAFAAVNSFSSIYFAFSNGIGNAARTLFSLFVGGEDRRSLKTTLKVVLTKAFPINVAISVVFAALSPLLAHLYFNNNAPTQTINLALQLFIIVPFALSFCSIGMTFSALYQCMKKMKIVNIISAIDGVVGCVLSMLIMCPFIQIMGVWLSWFTSNLFVIGAIIIYTVIGRKHFPKTFDDWLNLPEDFGTTQDMRLNFSVHNDDEVVQCSEKVMAFLETKSVDHRRTYYAGLALEEMAANVIDHGYKKDNKKHSAVIEAIAFPDRLVLKIMDDCIAFNPLSKDLVLNPDDPMKNIGIRMVQKLATQVTYYRMVSLNVLVITIAKEA